MNDEQEVKKRFNEWIKQYLPEGVQGEFDHFLSLEDYNTTLMAVGKVSGNLGAATGKRFFLPALFFEAKSKHPFVTDEKREIPVDIHYPVFEEDDVTYRIPAGYALEGGPQATNISWPQRAALTIATTATDNKIDVVRKLVYNYTILQSSEYGDLHGFYQKVAAADQQQLILKKAANSSGN